MPVRLNAFPELPNGRRPIYVTQQKNEALYFKLDEGRVRRWLAANGVLSEDAAAEHLLAREGQFSAAYKASLINSGLADSPAPGSALHGC